MPQYTRGQLITMARSIVEEVGGQAEAGRRLGCSKALVGAALAVADDDRRRDGTLLRIVQELGGRTVRIEDIRVFHIETPGQGGGR